MRTISCALLCLAIGSFVPAHSQETVPFTDDDRHLAGTVLEDMQQAIADNYYPREKIGRDFAARCAETQKALAGAQSNIEAYALIADALASLDPHIRFYPPPHQVRVDYSWQWRLIGNNAFVTQIDHEGDAARKGLQLGDKVVSLEGAAVSRDNYQQVDYTFLLLAPRPGLRILVESPGQEPRWLAVASTLRPRRKIRTSGAPTSVRFFWELSESDKRHRDEFLDLRQHLHRAGNVAVWRALELERDLGAVADGVKEIRTAGALVLDLRGAYVARHETIMSLLDSLFLKDFDAGVIKHERRFDDKLHVQGRPDAFTGTVLVLVDSETGAYAEVFARIIQQRQRGVIIGDRTMGRMIDGVRVHYARGAEFNFTTASVLVPTGEIVLSGDSPADTPWVIPDLLLNPAPSDLAARRDVVLAKALAMLKQKTSPEDAYKIVHLPSEDDDDND